MALRGECLPCNLPPVPKHVTVRRGTVGRRTGVKIEAFEDVERRRFSNDLDVEVEPQE